MKIAPKLTLMLIFFAGALLTVVATLAYINGRNSLETAARAELLATALEKEAALQEWILDERNTVTAIAETPGIRTFVDQLTAAAPGSEAAHTARASLLERLAPWSDGNYKFLGMSVLDPHSGEVIVATDPAEEGKFRENLPYFIEGRKSPYVQPVYYSLEAQGVTMTTSAPVRSADGRLLAVLTGRLNLEDMNDIIGRRTGMHQTDDTFLVNTSNLIVTPPRFLPDPRILQSGVRTEAVNRCIKGNSGVISALDYRGVPAIIVYRWLPDRGMCLIVKQDEGEVIAPVQSFGRAVALTGGLTLLATVALAYVLARTVTRPIKTLNEAVNRYGAGDLAFHPPKITRDEIGGLAEGFIRMTEALADKDAQLRAYTVELERRVEERTAQLREREYLLSESQRVAHIGSWQYELATERVTWSEETYRIYGVAAETFTPSAEALIGLLHPEDQAAMGKWIADALAGKEPAGLDFRVALADGSIRIVHGRGELLRDENSAPLRLIGTVQDITEQKLAEDALQESEERFRTAFEQAAVGIAHVSLRGGFLRLNQRFCDIVGYTQEEMQRLTFQEITHPDDLETDLGYVRKVLAGEIKTYSMEKRYTRKDGATLWVNLTVSLVRGASGEPNYFIAIVEDISARKKAEEDRRRYADRLEGMQSIDRAILAVETPEAIAQAALPRLKKLIPCQRANVVLFDFEGGLARFAANVMDGDLGPGAEATVPLDEFSPAETLHLGPVRYVEDILEINPRPAILERLLAKGIRCFMTAPLVVGEKLLGELNISATTAAAFTAEHLDIAREVADQLAVATQQANLRQALEQHAEELEQRVTERTRELSAANKELEAFSYSVSHDLRAPLRAIDGFSRILLEDYAVQLPTEAGRYLDLVRSNTQQMGQLVDDLLNLSRLSRQPLIKQKVLPSELMKQALADLRREQEGRQVEITVGDLPECQGDPALLKQVFVNLLANALKFTRKREVARIEVGCADIEGERVCVVRDNGVGFDMQYADKLFQVFQRLHRAEEYEGTGVGLAIVQRIIHRHGGRVWAEAQVDQGATFYFTL